MSKIRGGRKIFALAQHEVSIEVPGGSTLDEQAFRIIMAASDVEEWGRALGDDDESTRLCRRDYDLIWRTGTASERKVVHRVVIFDWQSKTRGEVHFEECAAAEPQIMIGKRYVITGSTCFLLGTWKECTRILSSTF